jgi:hypothetical protein
MTAIYKAKIKLGQELDKEKTSWITGNLLHKESTNKNTDDSFYIVPKNFTVFDGKLNDQIPVKAETICQHVAYHAASNDDIFANDLLVSLNHNLRFIVNWNSQFHAWELAFDKQQVLKNRSKSASKLANENTELEHHTLDSVTSQIVYNLIRNIIPHNKEEFNIPAEALHIIDDYWRMSGALPFWIINYLELEKFGNLFDNS